MILDFSELARQFTLGNAAILTNACLLPLYPGLMAFLAGNASNARTRRASGWLGVLVLAGVLTMMLLIGLILYALNAAFGDVLQVLLPALYALIIAFGLLMLTGRNPFARLSSAQAPVFKNPYVTAYVYGLFFGPMTLPCTGPVITTVFVLGASSGGNLGVEIVYVLAFGLGFGWPLVILPLFALPFQRRITGWLAQNHEVLTRASGILLVAIGIFGFLTEILPKVDPNFYIAEQGQLLYWLVVFMLAIGVGYYTYRHNIIQRADIVGE